MSQFFINRPIFAWVIAIFIVMAGIFGIKHLPISQYPSVAAPTITLTATYPGASAKVMEDSVLSVIERQMNGVEGLDYMSTSATATGTGTVSITFTPSTNGDIAQVNVQNRLSQVESVLPASVQQNGVTVTKSQSNFLMVVSMSSKTMSAEELADYTERNVRPELQRVTGIGEVRLFGDERAMRIWVDPNKLRGYNLSFSDVTSAISAQNVQISAGSLGDLPASDGQTINATVTAQGQLSTVKDFENIIIKSETSGAALRLKDVAQVSLGSKSYSTSSKLDGEDTVGMGVMLSTSGNAMESAKLVRAKMTQLQKYFPQGVTWSAPYDTSEFVSVSIDKVIHTLLEALLLVFIVMFVFLQNFRYTIIPTIAVPVSLMGTFAVMWYLGYSINVLTMFAMVLVIGIVVDDAIVVVENVERVMSEEGLSPKEAAKKGMGQISGAVIGITAVLVSVFVPLAMFSGATGNIYRQFAVVMAVSIVFSAFLALTLTPAMCATFLKPIAKGQHVEKKGFFGWFNRHFDTTTKRYEGLVAKLLRRSGRMAIIYVLVIGLAGLIYTRVPSSFMPTEDQGTLMVSVQLPPGATKARTAATMAVANKVIMSMPEVEHFFAVSGFSFSGSGQNMGLGFVILKDWAKRTHQGEDATSMAGKITGALMGTVRDGFAIAVVPPAISELGNNSGFDFYLQDRGSVGHEQLLAKRNELVAKMRQNPMFADVRTSGVEDAPQLQITLNRDAMAAQNVTFSSVSSMLATAMGSTYVNDFPNSGRLQRVIVQANAKDRMQPEDILRMNVANTSGSMVPLSSVATVSWVNGEQQSVRFNGYSSLEITGSPAAGYTTGQVMAELQNMVDGLGGSYGLEWSGQSREEAKAGSQTLILYSLSILAVFLVLAALYESWTIPLAVILVVPLGILGVVFGAWVRNYSNDLFFQVGMITVIGLSAKNAILIIEFAKDLQAQGRTALEAALEAAHLRFRPILMTSFAFILGVVPLYFASGASSASQRSIGTAVFWGMLIGTMLALFMVPSFYAVIRNLFKSKKKSVTTGLRSDR